MTSFWSTWIVVLTLACIVFIILLLFANRKSTNKREDNTTGHEYDGIIEQDNPLPAWWFNLFLGSIVFGAIYLVFYPGLGSYRGLLGWTSTEQHDQRAEDLEERFKIHFAAFDDLSFDELAQNKKAIRSGKRLFSTNCAVCHGSTGEGSTGFPDLTDSDWLYGDKAETIIQSITSGRSGLMPAWGQSLGEEKINHLVDYIQKMPSNDQENLVNLPGHKLYTTNCAACHGAEGKGNPALGAPRLNDDIWLYGGDKEALYTSIDKGRNGAMPAHDELLSKEKIRLLAAYVKSIAK